MSLDSYNSIIFQNFLQPITQIVFNLVRDQRQSVPWKTNEVDLDWILAGILLTVTKLDCVLRWTHVNRCPELKVEDARALYSELRKGHPSLPDIDEVFMVRNAIAHGHAWSVAIPKEDNTWLEPIPIKVRQKNDWNLHVDSANKCTKVLSLHMIPTLMDRRDFKLVLQTAANAMESLVYEKLLLPQALTAVAVWPDGSGRRIKFSELREEI